jgi:Fe-Mn family superoxide dismutase
LGRLVNQSAADHAHGLAGAIPILALDMYEHAYHLDFGAKAASYVDQVMANLNWKRISARYRLGIGEGKQAVRRAGARRGAEFGGVAKGRARGRR